MPIRIWVEKDRRLVRAVVMGSITVGEIVEAIDASIRDPDFEPGFDILSDHTAIGEPLTPSQAQQTAAHLMKFSPSMAGARWAVVVGTPASYGMMRMLAVLLERIPMTLRAFTSLADAEAWLARTSERPRGGG